MRRIFLSVAILALSACSSGQGLNPIVKDSLSKLNPFKRETPQEQRAARAQLTRESINRTGAAVIRARLTFETSRFLFFAASENDAYVTYASNQRQTMTLRGSQITGTRGLGVDLLWSKSAANDPLARAIPPANWPTRISRSYSLPGEGPQGKVLTFNCTLTRGELSDIEIVEVLHRGVQFSEECSNDEMSFENLHLADIETGFVWRSLQWVGPELGHIDLEIIEPYTAE